MTVATRTDAVYEHLYMQCNGLSAYLHQAFWDPNRPGPHSGQMYHGKNRTALMAHVHSFMHSPSWGPTAQRFS